MLLSPPVLAQNIPCEWPQVARPAVAENLDQFEARPSHSRLSRRKMSGSCMHKRIMKSECSVVDWGSRLQRILKHLIRKEQKNQVSSVYLEWASLFDCSVWETLYRASRTLFRSRSFGVCHREVLCIAAWVPGKPVRVASPLRNFPLSWRRLTCGKVVNAPFTTFRHTKWPVTVVMGEMWDCKAWRLSENM